MQWQDKNSVKGLSSVLASRGIRNDPPEMDSLLLECFLGYQFLSEERHFSIGMGGAIPNTIPLASMCLYYDTFEVSVSRKHFIKVVRSADSEYIKLFSEKQQRKSSSARSKPLSTQSDPFPKIPNKAGK